MPADRLTRAHAGGPRRLDQAANTVLSVLAGTPLTEAAARGGLEPTVLADAVEVFLQAGLRALAEQAAVHHWWQIYLEFADWTMAETTAARHLLPLLQQAEADGLLTGWWFIRKHPCWRLRLPLQSDVGVKTRLGDAFDKMAAERHLTRWWPGIYEPELVAFGGRPAMDAAHRLFHADSRAVLGLASGDEAALGRPELSVLLLTTLLRAAGLEWYEQGEVWDRVCHERPLPDDVAAERLASMSEDLKPLLLADTDSGGPLFGPGRPIAACAPWADGFRQAGRSVGNAARAGMLQRGLRDVLSYHVIFHWNRINIPPRMQSALARAARDAILGPIRATGNQVPQERTHPAPTGTLPPGGWGPFGVRRGRRWAG
ncbi:thiopeptide-type bacteriocin biosynthesis protein [Wenjunlia tyrosinilytica]|uniref:Thiopeptide-type bacteriocin biosynthesis domain-containing protein n=1 Tax=Wenjunlia tyrosinilytica TaxID=1544741 RepID=A0A917ZXP4_9ACTN|nr:thiopeptide-type bacteriocin biosynthesis protein [Wenjunlia tyrosinilytica]GGO96000.1 hypothetical protein GCM10012280_54500 [Wenjunlia tyrosinilytica]